MTDITCVVRTIVQLRDTMSADRAVLVAITGIDGSGKGFLAAAIVEALRARGLKVAGLGVDGWLNLPARRFSVTNPAEHFDHDALRLDEMWRPLGRPLRDHHSLRVEAEHAEETATAYRRRTYDFETVDVIVLEGIYLLTMKVVGVVSE